MAAFTGWDSRRTIWDKEINKMISIGAMDGAFNAVGIKLSDGWKPYGKERVRFGAYTS